VIGARLRRALPATGLVHVVTSVCALASAVSLASSAPATELAEPERVGQLFTVVRLLDALGSSPLRYGLVPGLLLLLAAPLLRVMWLRAQLSAADLSQHARAAASVYPQALAIHALALAYAALLSALALLVGRALSFALAGTHDLRLQQSVALLFALPLVLAALAHAPSVSDRAQLELARGERRVLPAVLAGLRAVDVRSCGLRAACELGAGMLALSAFLPRLWLGSNALVSLLLLGQLCALGQTALRAAWLAWLCERAERTGHAPGVQAGRAPGPSAEQAATVPLSPPESESPAPHAAGSTTPTR